MALSLDSSVLDQLNTQEARALHEMINQLSSCGVGSIVNLPQIIVVGEQSAGKSSVLEAITHVRFPVKDNLCTRFATEFVLRKAPKTRVDISIRFADVSKPDKKFQRTDFREDDLPNIIEDAKDCMGLAATGRDYSKDVLRLEIEGPSMYPLTLVDLPGLYHVETENQSEGGKKTVEEIVETYMKKTQSIILVVITASNQLANHIALRKVKEFDPKRERTLGVITKPDLTRPGYSDERTYMQVAKNQERAHKLKLGWHVLRNRAEDEPTVDERDAKEDRFFQETAWGTLPPQDRGIASLRRRLSRILYEHIRKNISSVVDDISGNLRARQEELDRLGQPRSNAAEMRSFLLSVAGEFQRLAYDGTEGRYSDPFFGDLDDSENKLRAQVRNYNRILAHILKTKGAKFAITEQDYADSEESDLPDFLSQILERYPCDFPQPEAITRECLKAQLRKQAALNQGREFPGLPNHELVIQLFQQQASPWHEIAASHINIIVSATRVFVDHLVRHIVGPEDSNQTADAILCEYVDSFFLQKELLLQDKLQELTRPYSRGFVMPLDISFQQAIERRTRARVKGVVDRVLNQRPGNHGEQVSRVSAAQIIDMAITQASEPSSDVFGTEQVIDMMQVHYKVCMVPRVYGCQG